MDAIAFVVHLGNNAPVEALLPSFNRSSGRSSGVEHDLAKVGVEGSNPFARSSFDRKCRYRQFGLKLRLTTACELSET
jgi:hypothetical protein